MIVIHTNSIASYTGEMVMGQGAAAQAKQIYSKLPKMMYKKIRSLYPEMYLNGTKDYGFLPIIDPPHGIGIFQTKQHWAEVARLDTIQRSVDGLAEYASLHPDVHFRLPFPGVGCGRWGEGHPPREEEIKRLLVCLPNNVTIGNGK